MPTHHLSSFKFQVSSLPLPSVVAVVPPASLRVQFQVSGFRFQVCLSLRSLLSFRQPMPRVEPVMSAHLPSSCFIFISRSLVKIS